MCPNALFAWRYLISHKSHSVINIIAGVSLFAIAIPVAAMVILLSVFNGFEDLVKSINKAIDADIEITINGGAEQYREIIEETEGVESLSFVVQRQVLLTRQNHKSVVNLLGADSAYYSVVPLCNHISKGSSAYQFGEVDRLIIGEGIAYGMGIFSIEGMPIEIYSISGGKVGSFASVLGVQNLPIEVGGMVRLDQNGDNTIALTSLRFIKRLYGIEQADKVVVKVKKGVENIVVKERLATYLPQANIVTRQEKNSTFYHILRLEKWTIFMVALMVLLIACFSIVGTMVMLILEKEEESTTLYSIGLTPKNRRDIFIYQGLFLTIIGGVFGLIIGLSLTLIQQHFGIVTMPADTFLVSSYPCIVEIKDIVLIIITTFIVSYIVSWVSTHKMIKN